MPHQDPVDVLIIGSGASGAAVQNLNLMIGAEETLGTDLPQAA